MTQPDVLQFQVGSDGTPGTVHGAFVSFEAVGLLSDVEFS